VVRAFAPTSGRGPGGCGVACGRRFGNELARRHSDPGRRGGLVRQPGVYEFHHGDRVIDAIDAAGGARRGAALDALNLAAPLADGTQILVPRREASEPAGSATSAPSVDGGVTSSKVNINSASALELEALPGIGEVIAQEILDYRTANGPFVSVDDLLDVSGIGEVTLENIRDLVTV